MKVMTVVGARPNLMKATPLMWAMKNTPGMESVLVHTGQHYDDALDAVFFRELGLPRPDYHLGVGSGSHAYQVAQVMVKLEKLLQEVDPDWLVVVGDINSTMAASLAAAKLLVPLAHVESGLRSFDRAMPEEVNRVVTDALANLLFVTEKSGVVNLRQEGVTRFLNGGEPIFQVTDDLVATLSGFGQDFPSVRLGAFVGNVMIDTLLHFRERASREARISFPDRDFALLTLHRPGNVDNKFILQDILGALQEVSRELPVLFPCHPRTRLRLKEYHLEDYCQPVTLPLTKAFPDHAVLLLEPLGYLDFLNLMSQARLILTDSGGIQEEATLLGVPCLTLRENTERPVTLSEGTNTLVGHDPHNIVQGARNALTGKSGTGAQPVLWDGHAAQRVVKIIEAAGVRQRP